MTSQLPLSLLAAFSADGRVYRAFDHYIAAGAGRLLLVPAALAYGDRAAVVAGCPVPVEDMSVLLDAPQELPAQLKDRDPLLRFLRSFAESGWRYDYVPMMPGQRRRVLRVMNDNGIRYAEVVR